jgi:hypothetical protein
MTFYQIPQSLAFGNDLLARAFDGFNHQQNDKNH